MRRLLPLRAALLLLAGALPVHAAGNEFEMPEAEVSLLSGGQSGETQLMAGLRIALPEGWKTYWRSPGDSGIPPSFDWSGSSNVAAIEISWPAPSLFDDGYGYVIGYENELVIPLRVTPAKADEPVKLDLSLDYAICKDICVPAQAEAEKMLPGLSGDRTSIERSLASVPQPVEPGSRYGVVSSEIVAGEGAQMLRVAARFPDDAADPRLLIEGPPDWYLAVPEEIARADDGARVFEVELPDQANPEEATFTATGLSSSFSFEQRFRLD